MQCVLDHQVAKNIDGYRVPRHRNSHSRCRENGNDSQGLVVEAGKLSARFRGSKYVGYVVGRSHQSGLGVPVNDLVLHVFQSEVSVGEKGLWVNFRRVLDIGVYISTGSSKVVQSNLVIQAEAAQRVECNCP